MFCLTVQGCEKKKDYVYANIAMVIISVNLKGNK